MIEFTERDEDFIMRSLEAHFASSNIPTSNTIEESINEDSTEPVLQEGSTIDELNEVLDEIISEERENVQESTEENESSETTNVIEENSATALSNETTLRFSSAVWYENIKSKKIQLVGCGGIGSWTALMLARLCPKELWLYDSDRIEAVNMAGQFFSKNQINEYKVNALVKSISDFTDCCQLIAVQRNFTSICQPTDIMITGLDNMESRKSIFRNWIALVESYHTEEKKKKCLFIDGRLSADTLQVLCIRGDDKYNQDRYLREFLFYSEEADQTICSFKQTTFMANMIGSVITNLFVNFCAIECNAPGFIDLPFFTEYSADTMHFKTES